MTREERSEYMKKWRAEHPDSVRASIRKWRETHQDQFRAYNREYRRKYYRLHTDKVREYNKTYSLKKAMEAMKALEAEGETNE